MDKSLIEPSCKFYYCTQIHFSNGTFSFIWKNTRFHGYNGSWEESSFLSTRLEGTIAEPSELAGIHIQVEVLHDKSRGYFTVSPQSRIASEKFSLLMLEHRTRKIHPLVARIEFIDQQNMQLATSSSHKIIMTRSRKGISSWGPRVFHGMISGTGGVTLYV